MAESIGTVRVDIIGNANDLKVEVERAKTLVSSMGPEFEKSYAKMNAGQKRATTSALQLAQTWGMSRDELKLLSLAARGAAPEALEVLRKKMQDTRNATNATTTAFGAQTKAFSGSSKTARELQFAMRGLPAQITDIGVSLASGQRPMMVLLQQGGQLKDMFGGIGPAARALGTALRGLINPFTLTAGAIGALGGAYLYAENQARSFERTFILTGGRLRLSADEMSALADSLDELSGVSRGEAVEALNKIAESGKVGADNFKEAVRAALLWQEATGTAVDETIAQLDRIRKDPVQAMELLKEKYGEVTDVQIEHVRRLDEQGEHQEAANAAFRAWADMVEDRAPKIIDNLDPIDRLQKSIADNAKEGWTDFSQGIHDTAREAEEGFGALSRFLNALGFLRAGPAGAMGFSGALNKPVQVPNTLPDDPTDKVLADIAALEREVYGPAAIEAHNRQVDAFIKAEEKAAQAAKKAAEQQKKEADEIHRRYENANAQLARQIALFGDVSNAAAVAYDTQFGALQDLSDAEKANLILKAQRLDALKEEQREWAEFEKDMEALDRVWADAARDAANARNKAAEKASKSMTEFSRQAARNMQNDFADFLFDPFKDGVDGMVDSFADAIRRMLAEAAAAKIFDLIGGIAQGKAAGGSSFWGFIASMFTKNADGAVYDSPSLSAYSNGIYNTPHLFKFARGAGVFGEAGYEAIMPLQRGKDGKLGVQANGGGVVVEINNYSGSPVSAREEMASGLDGESLRKIVIDIAADDMAAGGKLARASKGRFGLKDAV